MARGWYFYKTKLGGIVIGFQFYGFKYPYNACHQTIDNAKEVLASVPSYDEYKQLVSKTEQLEKKLKIAMETLQKIADYQTDVLLQYWAEGALNKIKEMEDVK